MSKFKGTIRSKLQKQETSIFAVMSALARKHKAINLSQGFPDFEVSGKLIDLVKKYMKNTDNISKISDYRSTKIPFPNKKSINTKFDILYSGGWNYV